MLKRKSLVGIAVAAGVSMLPALYAQQSTRPSSLSAQDYIEIQQLVSRYSFALDTGADKGSMFANLFASDGSFQNDKGREALTRLAWQHMPEQGSSYVKHFIMNHVIEPTPGGVIGKEYVSVLMIGEGGKTSAITVGGVYHDQYVKTPEGWRFKTRKFVASKAGPEAVQSEPQLSLDLKPLAPVVASDQKTGGRLTAEDYLEIQQLVSRYPYALDTGAGTGTMYSHLFTPDGVFGRSIGREAITKMAWQHMPQQGPLYAKHFITNHVIEPTPTGATGREYIVTLAVGEGGKPTTITTGGLYDDVYEKTSDGWRFKTRKFSGAKYVAPPAAAGGAALDSRVADGKPSARAVSSTPRGKASTLTSLDYIEIGQLASRYAYAADTGADGGTAYAELFDPAGVMNSQGRPYQGREQLADLARRNARGPSAVFQFITNHVIEPTPEGAMGKCYLAQLTIGENGRPGIVNGGGRYEDVYVKTAKGWRFKSRVAVPSKAGPQP